MSISQLIHDVARASLAKISEMVRHSLFTPDIINIKVLSIQALPTIRSPIELKRNLDESAESIRPLSVGSGELQSPSPSSLKLPNRTSLSTSQNASEEMEKRGTSKGKGRVSKVLGDLFLLAGSIPVAITHYAQSIEILRLTTDYVWHASALEGIGMALVLMKYLKPDFTVELQLDYADGQIPTTLMMLLPVSQHQVHPLRNLARTPDEGPSISDNAVDQIKSLLDMLPDLHTQILNLYQRSLLSPSIESTPPICLSDHVIRLSTLLSDVYISGDLDALAIRANVLGGNLGSVGGSRCPYPPRGEIARWAIKAISPYLSDGNVLPVFYKLDAFATLAQIMGKLGFPRKRAMLVYELLRLMTPILVQARVNNAAEWGIHPSAVALNVANQSSGDDDVSDLMASFIAAFGTCYPKFDNRNEGGWPELKAESARQCLTICEALSQPAGVAYFTSLLLGIPEMSIEKEEQIRLASNLPRATSSARKRGLVIEAEYWDPFVLHEVELGGYNHRKLL
jgi:trafficking protein particle complex subunit 9